MSESDVISSIQDWKLVKQGINNPMDIKTQDNDDKKESSILAHLTQRKVLPPGGISDTAKRRSGNKTPNSKSNSITSSESTIIVLLTDS